MTHLVDFRTLQEIGDLTALIGDIYPVAINQLGLDDATRTSLHALSDDPKNRSELALTLFPEVFDLAIALDQSDAVFTFTNAVVLSTLLLHGETRPETFNITTNRAARLRALPTVSRAALANGFRRLAVSGSEQRSLYPKAEDCISVDLEKVCARLVELAQAVTEPELEHIAKADYQNDREEHYAALKTVIFEQDCVFSDEQSWVPSEVVELISHIPAEPGFGVATAVLLTHCLRKGDMQGHTDFRWQNNAAAYLAMPDTLRHPILAGFRYIYETDPGWCPHFSALFDPYDHHCKIIPPVGPELTQM
jgi:hypothetical protein